MSYNRHSEKEAAARQMEAMQNQARQLGLGGQTAGLGGLMNEPQMSEMQRQMEFLRSCVGRLSKAISDMEERLEPVLSPAPPETQPLLRASSDTTSPLSHEIGLAAMDLDSMLDRVNFLTRRLTI